MTSEKFTSKQGITFSQGLQELRQQHDCSYIQIRLSFKRGLHPFYPPMLVLLHPRMKGPVNGALASHPVVQLQHWDPWGTQRELAAKLKGFLQVAHPCSALKALP